jgi:hypothetical protein
VRFPARWKTDQARQGDLWYRYFQAPPWGDGKQAPVTTTLIATPLSGTLESHAQRALLGLSVSGSREETRPGAKGRSWTAVSPDGATRHHLLLLQEETRVYGLHAQGPEGGFRVEEAALAALMGSLALERWALYAEERNDAFGYSLRVPPSWKATRSFSGGGTYLKQFTSPALGMDRGGQTVHASLTLTAEALPAGATVDTFYQAANAKHGEAFQLISHTAWKDGYVDLLRTETPMAESRGKRFYRIADGRGYTLAFEARADVYPRVSRWCDMIAATFETGAERDAK